MSPDRIAEIRSDLLEFNRHMFRSRRGVDMMMNDHFRDICNTLERVVIGDINRLIINMPPRAGKTETAVKNFMAWCMGNWPHSHFIHASYSKRLATSNTYEVRAIMQHEEYAKIFAHTDLAQDSKAKDEFRTAQGGIVYATGAEGTITGYGAGGMGEGFHGAIVIDDPHKAGEGDSDIRRESVLEWFQTTMESRKNNVNTPIIVIMQRLHESDLSGWLLNGGNGEKWHHLRIEAINEDGNSFWEEKFPLSVLERMEKANPYVFAGQYMQDPTPRSGGDFKVENIQIVDALPAGLRLVRGWDLASTVKKRSDYTASVAIGVCEKGITWIADADRFKGTPDEVESSIKQYAELDGKGVFISLPQDPGQAGVAQKSSFSRLLNGFSFEVTPESGDKRTRASPLAAQVNAGNVRMVKSDWNKDFISELRVFPNGTNDDQVDAASRAYNKAAEHTKKQWGFLL